MVDDQEFIPWCGGSGSAWSRNTVSTKHVNRSDQVIPVADMARFMCDDGSNSAGVNRSKMPSGSNRIGRKTPKIPGSRTVGDDLAGAGVATLHRRPSADGCPDAPPANPP